jgi:formiminoglutamase
MTKLYSPITDHSVWSGRTDALPNEYVWQIIQYLDLNNMPASLTKISKSYGLLGFESDTGVRRNQGNPGSREGPASFRRALARVPVHSTFELYDAGNVTCATDDLETAQTELGTRVANILSCNLMPVVIGGGHETAWGHFQGLTKHYPDAEIAILNFDAHFDLRPLIDGQFGSSGTPFRQIHDWLKVRNKPFHYYCAGIQPLSNTKSLFDYAKANHVNYLLAEKIHEAPHDLSFIQKIIQSPQHIYVSLCLDVFSAAIAPGVSAPQPLGIEVSWVVEALKMLKTSGKVISLDIVELAPSQDIHAVTAKLAAMLLMTWLMA